MKNYARLLQSLLLCALCWMLLSCGSTSALNVQHNATPFSRPAITVTSTSPTARPTGGKGRPASMPPVTQKMETDPTLIYTQLVDSSTTVLRRYDTVTRRTTDILKGAIRAEVGSFAHISQRWAVDSLSCKGGRAGCAAIDSRRWTGFANALLPAR